MRVAKVAPLTCADIIVIFLGEDPIVVPMVRNHLESVSFMDMRCRAQENRVIRIPSGNVVKEKRSLHIHWMIAV